MYVRYEVIHTCDMAYSYESHESCICRIRMCDTWHIRMCDMTQLYVWLICMCDMSRSNMWDMIRSYVERESFIHGTWLVTTHAQVAIGPQKARWQSHAGCHESRHTYEWDMSQKKISYIARVMGHVTRMNESWCIGSRMQDAMSHVTHMNESRHRRECILSRM